MKSMRERIARIMQEHWMFGKFDELTDDEREDCYLAADAVLSELETPTEGMVEAHAKCEANEWDKRPLEQLGRADRERYLNRGSAAFTAAIRAAKEGK